MTYEQYEEVQSEIGKFHDCEIDLKERTDALEYLKECTKLWLTDDVARLIEIAIKLQKDEVDRLENQFDQQEDYIHTLKNRYDYNRGLIELGI